MIAQTAGMALQEPESGPGWADRARLPGLASVIDHTDAEGTKNALIDRTHKRALGRALGQVEGRRLLDFGCGTGRISAWLSRRGADVDGVDPCDQMVKAARRSVPNARFTVLGDRIPFPANEFDVVVSVTVLQYLVREPNRLVETLRECRRCLRPDGVLLAVEQIAHESLGRGGSCDSYVGCFERAELGVFATVPVRLGESQLLRRLPRRLWQPALPFLPALLAREARMPGRLDLGVNEYAEVLFAAQPVDNHAGRPASQL
jgi:SAM-dependent methyltransferase